MSEQMSLEDVLDGKEPEVVEPEAQEEAPETTDAEEVEVVAEAEPTPTEDTTEEPEPKGDVVAEPPSAETTKEVPLAAMLDERDKRKEAQAALEALRAERDQEKKEKTDFWENPEAAIQEAVGQVEEKFQQQLVAGRLELSMQIAKTYHDDYDTGLESFKTAAEENPALVDQALQSEHPGEYIYKVGKQFAELDSMGGDLEAMRDQIRNEERAKLMQELKGKETTKASVPTPLTDETSAMAPRETVEGGPSPLESFIRSD